MLYSLTQVGVGGVVGIVVAIVALVGVIAAVLIVCYRRKAGGRQQQAQHMEGDPHLLEASLPQSYTYSSPGK